MEQENRTFRFAVMGAGNIANKFCDAVKHLEGSKVVAIASKSMERAQAFAEKNGLEKAYDSYEKMLVEEKPDCVYIAVTSDAHYALSVLCLEYDVPVLCEKAMFLNSTQAEEVFALAKEKNLFVMEAMWSRFLPTIRKAKEWVETGKIGALVYGDIAIGFQANENPDNRYFSPKLGGGAAYDLTVYCYEIITYVIERPVEVISAVGMIGETGVDVTDQVVLRFPGVSSAGVNVLNKSGLDSDPDVFASLKSTFLANFGDKMVIYGKKGRIEVPDPHYGSEAFLYDEAGNCIERFHDEITENGFVYEAAEVMRCIREGRIESETVPHSLTIACARVFDEIYKNA